MRPANKKPKLVLVVGATGSVGRLAVAESIHQGYETRALVRERGRGKMLPDGVQIVVGDLTRPETLPEAVAGVDAIVFTHGTHGGAKAAQAVDYEGVRNVLSALGDRPVRIALMTAIGVTSRTYPTHDWKRRSERLVRATGLPYTIVRPGWFDYNEPDQLRLVMLQGDTRTSGTPADGVVSRQQIAQVLVASLASEAADHKTFELVAERGAAQADLEPLFAALRRDLAGAFDAVEDIENMPLAEEPDQVRRELESVRTRRG